MLPSTPETLSSLGKMDFLQQKKRPTVAPVVLLSVNIYRLSVKGEKVHREKQPPVDLLFVYRRESPVRLSIGATVAQRWEKARVKYYCTVLYLCGLQVPAGGLIDRASGRTGTAS